MSEKIKEGWFWPPDNRKAHYFKNELTSICGKYMCLYIPEPEQGNNYSSDNCAACKKKLKKLGIIKTTGITKFIIKVAELEKDMKVLAGREWDEPYDTNKMSHNGFWATGQEVDLDDAKRIGLNMINYFNQTLREHEKPRKLVAALLVEDKFNVT